jgi:DNA-binding transcriptional regulator YiaG
MKANELKDRRARMGLTQVELAESLGVTWNTVARWETGQRKIPEMAVRLLDCLSGETRVKQKNRRG